MECGDGPTRVRSWAIMCRPDPREAWPRCSAGCRASTRWSAVRVSTRPQKASTRGTATTNDNEKKRRRVERGRARRTADGPARLRVGNTEVWCGPVCGPECLGTVPRLEGGQRCEYRISCHRSCANPFVTRTTACSYTSYRRSPLALPVSVTFCLDTSAAFDGSGFSGPGLRPEHTIVIRSRTDESNSTYRARCSRIPFQRRALRCARSRPHSPPRTRSHAIVIRISVGDGEAKRFGVVSRRPAPR